MGLRKQFSIPLDEVARAVATIEYEHHEIHDGDMFQGKRLVTGGDNSTHIILLRTGAKLVHAEFSFGANVEARAELFSAPTLTASGTLLPSYNRNRSSAKTPLTTLRDTATYSLSGTRLEPFIGGSTGFKEGTGAGGQSRHEWILNVSTVYMWRVTVQAGSAEAELGVEFYEKTA